MNDNNYTYTNINFTIPSSTSIANIKSILSLLSSLDFDFCKTFNIGPFFLNTIPNLFTDDYINKSLLILTKLIRHCNLHSLHSNTINPQTFFSNITVLCKLLSFPDKPTAILYCGSMNFRIPLYILHLNTITIPSQALTIINTPSPLPQSTSSSVKHQIELDIPRTSFQYPVLKEQTFRNNFKQLLYEIARRDTTLSYVQGMNFIAAFILMFTGNQLESSLFIYMKLLYLKSNYFNREFRYCYINDFMLMREYIVLFKDMLYRYECDIYNVLIENEIDGILWLSKWIQTLYVLNFKFEFTMKLWDVILVYGLDSVVSIAISIIKYYEKKINKVNDLEMFMDVLDMIYKDMESEDKAKKMLSYIVGNIINNVYPL